MLPITCPFAALSRIEALARFVMSTQSSIVEQAALAEIIGLAQEVSNEIDVEAENV
jgi:hypothetical protein